MVFRVFLRERDKYYLLLGIETARVKT